MTTKRNMFHVPLYFAYLLIGRNLNANVIAPRMHSGTVYMLALAKQWKNSRIGHKKPVVK